jgi:hypothetical protein
MKAKKFRKYEEGGSIREGRNENIDDDTRARAMEAVRRRMAGEEDSDSAPAPKAAKKPTAKPIKKVSGFSISDRQGMNELKPASKASDEVPRFGQQYKQDTYETPLKSAVRKMAPGIKDNLGKIVGGMGVGYGAFKGVSKLIDAARAADKGRATAALAKGNAGLAERMKGVVSTAEKAVADKAAAKAARQPYNQATEERLTGLAMNPRRKNIPVKSTSDSGKSAPVKVGKKMNDDEAGIEFRKGGKAKCYAKGGSVSSRADGCATKGKTNCRVY